MWNTYSEWQTQGYIPLKQQLESLNLPYRSRQLIPLLTQLNEEIRVCFSSSVSGSGVLLSVSRPDLIARYHSLVKAIAGKYNEQQAQHPTLLGLPFELQQHI